MPIRVGRSVLANLVNLVWVIAALAACTTRSSAQSHQETGFKMRYEFHGGIGLPSGFALGARILTGRDAGIEASVGTVIAAVTFNAGVNFPAPSILEGTRPTWSILGTYFSAKGFSWYCVTGMYGLLQLGVSGLHSYVRLGASLLTKRASAPGSAILLYPFPAFDVGLAWTLPGGA